MGKLLNVPGQELKLSDTKVSVLNNFYSKDPVFTLFSGIGELLMGDYLKSVTSDIRASRAVEKDESQPLATRLKAKGEADKKKNTTPMLVPNVLLKHGKDRKNIVGFLPFVGFDIDHLTKQRVVELMTILRNNSHISFAQPSSSESGIHGIVHIDAADFLNEQWDGKKTDAYLYVWNKVREYVEPLLGEQFDEACKNPERGFALCYDERTFFNFDAEPLHIDTSGYQKPKVGRPRKNADTAKGCSGKYHAQLQEVEEWIAKSLEKNGKKAENGRNNYLYAFAMECNRFGVEEQEVRDWATTHLLAEDFEQKEIDTTIASAYAHTDVHGTMTNKLNDIDFIAKELHDIADFRYNETLGRMELKYKSDFMDIAGSAMAYAEKPLLAEILQKLQDTQVKKRLDWHVLSDRDFSTLYTSIRSKRKVYQNEVNAVLSSLTFCENFNPMQEYLLTCPQWDPSQPDEILALFNHLKLKHTDRHDRLAHYFKMWFVRMVAMGLGLTDANQLMISIVGVQNTGKTYFTKMILPPELREQYYQKVHPNEPLDKDLLISLSAKFIVDLDEFTISKAISSTVKAIISGGKKSVRKPYGRYAEVLRSVASLMLTCNDSVFIGEPEGDRRYVTLEIVGTVNFGEAPINYQRLYAQALYLIANGELRESLTSEEVSELSSFNEEYVEEDPCQNAILTFFRKPQAGDTNVKWMTNYQIRSHFANSSEYNETNVGRALSKLGYNDKKFKKKVNGIWKYAVVELPREIETTSMDSDTDVEENNTDEGYWYDNL